MTGSISHDIRDESLEAKVRWFQSLSLEERMDVFVAFTNLILENNPGIVRQKYVRPASELFASFQRNDVKYLVIGGIAAVLYGVPRATFDLDVLSTEITIFTDRVRLDVQTSTPGIIFNERGNGA